MQIPPEIAFRGIKVTPSIEDLLSKSIAKLEKVCNYIVSTRIAVEQEQGRHKTGNPYRMRIDIRIPGRKDIIVERTSAPAKIVSERIAGLEAKRALEGEPEPEKEQVVRRSPLRRRGLREEPLPTLIRRSFEVAQRELEKEVDKQRHDVKAHSEQQMTAVVETIFPAQDYGFLRTVDGEQVYFHRNSVLHNHWERLTVGTGVRYEPQLGEKGMQASTVELVDKRGAAEAHGRLHDLPGTGTSVKAKGKRGKARRASKAPNKRQTTFPANPRG